MRTEREHGWRVAVVVFAAAVTVTAVLVPAFRLHLDSPASGAIALALRGAASLFVCALAAERFARTASRLDATIGVAFGILAVADLGFALDRAALSSAQVSSAPVLPYRVIAAAVLAWAAVAPDRVIVRRPRTRLILLSCGVVIIPVFVAQRLGFLPGTDVAPAHEPTEVVVLRALIAALLAVAAIGLTARRDREGDPLVRWLAVALAVGVLVQVQRLAIPAASSPQFTWANVLQVVQAAVLMVACAGEIRSYHRRLTELAVADERRRIARDLHDSVAQDVAFIASQSKHLSEEGGDEKLALITLAAERALADSRGIVRALTRASTQPLSASIALQAQEFARRWSLKVDVATSEDVAVDPEKQEAVLRIVGEALSNAARHAGATKVWIEVAAGDGPLHVAVSDDGRGFDPESPYHRGFGLLSMRERAELVGGEVSLLSEPGRGTRVEIAIP